MIVGNLKVPRWVFDHKLLCGSMFRWEIPHTVCILCFSEAAHAYHLPQVDGDMRSFLTAAAGVAIHVPRRARSLQGLIEQ